MKNQISSSMSMKFLYPVLELSEGTEGISSHPSTGQVNFYSRLVVKAKMRAVELTNSGLKNTLSKDGKCLYHELGLLAMGQENSIDGVCDINVNFDISETYVKGGVFHFTFNNQDAELLKQFKLTANLYEIMLSNATFGIARFLGVERTTYTPNVFIDGIATHDYKYQEVIVPRVIEKIKSHGFKIVDGTLISPMGAKLIEGDLNYIVDIWGDVYNTLW